MKPTTGSVFYLKHDAIYDDTKPYFCYLPPQLLNGAPVTNQLYVLVETQMTDIRGQEHDFSLDQNGFEVAAHPLDGKYNFETLGHDTSLLTEYEHGIEKFLEKKLEADKVVVFDHELRKRNPEFPDSQGDRSALEQPVRGVHIDSSPASALERAVYTCNMLGERERLSHRIQIINTWRPLFGPLRDWPLALCDSRSIDVDEDLILSDSVFPDTVSETLQMFHSSRHRWYFLNGQTTDEMLLFKIFDSDETVSQCNWSVVSDQFPAN